MTKDSVSFTSHYLKTDITALKFIEKYLLAGAGNILHVYDISTFELILRKQIFPHYRIHGIHPYDEGRFIAVNGNRCITVISSPNLNCYELSSWNVDDWVWDIKWFTHSDIVILTASNTVFVWNYETKFLKKEARCPVKCSLYSGQIVIEGSQLDDIVVLSGTCFKKIIVWMPFHNNTVTHILQGHEGAIFSVFFNEKLNLISTASDDRTVRIWKLSSTIELDSINKCDRWRHSSIDLQFTIYGHISRVWKSVILDNELIISISEDSQLRIWDLCGNPLQQWETHQGGSVWCLDVHKKLSFIVTGGKDGGISSWPLPVISDGCVISRSFVAYDGRLNDQTKRTIPRRIVFTKRKQLIIVTEDGTVSWSDRSSDYHLLNIIFVDSRFSSYCLLEVSLRRTFICLASIDGTIIILKEKDDDVANIIKIFDKRICDGKIFSVHWLEGNHLITCVSDGKLELWKLARDNQYMNYELFKTGEFSLPLCKERWLTSALKYNSCIIVGDRDGSIHLYILNDNSFNNNGCMIPSSTFRRVHSKLGVSSICRCTKRKICSIGRDGYIRYWTVLNDRLECISADKLTVKWPVHIFKTKTYGLLVLGFNETNLELWSIGERRQILKCKCGGGHRSWDFIFDDRIYFAYTKMASVFALDVSLDRLIKPPFLAGFHAREINSVICLNRRLLISASEDTTLRFSALSSDYDDVHHVAILRSHISSIKTISCVETNGHYYVVSAGGRAQLKIWKINLKRDGFHDISNTDRFYQELASHMLKNEDKISRPWRTNQPKAELEPRYMDVKILKHQSDLHRLITITACSDGILRIFTFDTNTNRIQMECDHHYSEHCILKIDALNVGNRFIIITMTTDGIATFWDVTEFVCKKNSTNRLETFYKTKLHQSGINGCDSIVLSDVSFVLSTGGDDTDLKITVFNISLPTQPTLMQKKVFRAHYSQITGIRLTDKLVISTSIDQRIKIWRWAVKNDVLTNLKLVYEYQTSVPDIHGIITWSCSRRKMGVCVYGAGVEVFKLSTIITRKGNKQLKRTRNCRNARNKICANVKRRQRKIMNRNKTKSEA